MDASLTRIRGRWRSSRSRELCSVSRRSLSSDMDCLCGREYMVMAIPINGLRIVVSIFAVSLQDCFNRYVFP